jgi:raffinose/stachyose/melibiose transport system substrate-binding protein
MAVETAGDTYTTPRRRSAEAHHEGGHMRRTALITAALTALAVLSACSGGGSGSNGDTPEKGPVTLTLWHNYGTEQNAVATRKLTDAYTAAHPNVTFKVVSQPGDNYFSLLQASAVSRTGPDIAVMWTGLFTLKYKKYLVDLKGKVPAATLKRVQGLQWSSDGFDASKATYVMPLEQQFYMGFYSKKAFSKAGVTAVPRTWDELYAACGKLKSAGYTPMVYGNGGQSLGAEFYPWYDASYMMIGAHSVGEWKNLYDGRIPWNDSSNVQQLSKWSALESRGCTNSDVLTKTNNLDDFTSGKAAMIVDGTWDTQKFTDAMKGDVAAFVPPFADQPIKGVVQYPGDGFSITSSSQHQAAAADFLAFVASDAGAKIINKAGLIPDLTGTTTSNPVNQQMLDFTAKQGYTPYPMLDNVVQGDVVDAGNKLLPPILAGKSSADEGLSQMNTAWKQLPTDQRGASYR